MDTIFLYALDVSALEADSAVWAAFVHPVLLAGSIR